MVSLVRPGMEVKALSYYILTYYQQTQYYLLLLHYGFGWHRNFLNLRVTISLLENGFQHRMIFKKEGFRVLVQPLMLLTEVWNVAAERIFQKQNTGINITNISANTSRYRRVIILVVPTRNHLASKSDFIFMHETKEMINLSHFPLTSALLFYT